MTPTFAMVGCIRVDPALNAAEYEYLAAFCESRRWDRPAGPYAVPGNPAAEVADPDLDLDAYLRPAPGQPGLWCPWRPGLAGRALVPAAAGAGRSPVAGVPAASTTAEPDAVVAWLTYLAEHFLLPDARARGRDGFAAFGFGHRLEGAAAVADRGGTVTFVRAEGSSVRVELACAAPAAGPLVAAGAAFPRRASHRCGVRAGDGGDVAE